MPDYGAAVEDRQDPFVCHFPKLFATLRLHSVANSQQDFPAEEPSSTERMKILLFLS
jgi:hypothetical protein